MKVRAAHPGMNNAPPIGWSSSQIAGELGLASLGGLGKPLSSLPKYVWKASLRSGRHSPRFGSISGGFSTYPSERVKRATWICVARSSDLVVARFRHTLCPPESHPGSGLMFEPEKRRPRG
eukprot:2152007-Prymnesium_polylepis.1